MDLGYTPEPVESPMTEGSKKKPETQYPTLTVRDGSVDALVGDHQCKVGDVYIADGVRLRAKSVSDDEMGKRLEFDVLSADEFEPEESEAGEQETDTDTEGDMGNGKKAPKALRYA